MVKPKPPLDLFPYDRDPRSQPLRLGVPDGVYVYVQDAGRTIRILPDGSHMHPRVLGNAECALYAGDLQIVEQRIVDITNLSGTFQFDCPLGLKAVADSIKRLGFKVDDMAVRFFPVDGSPPFIVS